LIGKLPIEFTLGRLLMRVRPAPLASLVKRMLRIRRLQIVTAEGKFWVDPASFAGLRLAETGFLEPQTLEAIHKALHSGDTFIDIGANEGYFTVVASRIVGATGRVIAVEPQERLKSVLARNLSDNLCENVEVVHAAISDHAGTATLHLAPDMNNSSSGLFPATRYKVATQQTAIMTLSQLMDRMPDARPVVKMDIEGFEHEAILGSEAVFRDGRIRVLILEPHLHLWLQRGLDVEALPRLLRACGYEQSANWEGRVWQRPAMGP
jgi:FkbM family methyltransferase